MPGFFFSIYNYFDCKHTYKKLNYNENLKKKQFLNSLILVLHFFNEERFLIFNFIQCTNKLSFLYINRI